MLSTFLAIAFAAGATAPEPQKEISLNSGDRWAFVTGLRERLGGPFLIANLASAEATCRVSAACFPVTALDRQAASKNVFDLISNTQIGKDRPVALVALRTGHFTGVNGGLNLVVSVYDPSNGQWSNKLVEMEHYNIRHVIPGSRRMFGYRDYSPS